MTMRLKKAIIYILAAITSFVVLCSTAACQLLGEGTTPPENEQTAVPEHSHDYQKGATVAPTCKTQGYTTYSCSCGSYYTDDYVALLKHTFDKSVVEEKHLCSKATCTESTLYYYSCSCGATGDSTFKVGKALGHDYELSPLLSTPATEGNAAVNVYVCQTCGDTYSQLA